MYQMWGPEKFFSPPSMEPLALSLGFVSSTTFCDFFSYHGFHVICCMSSISIFSFSFDFFFVPLCLGFILVLVLAICFFVS